MSKAEFTLRERDETGRETGVYVFSPIGEKPQTNIKQVSAQQSVSITRILRGVFLPAGFPNTVSDDYLRYQILNACQAFCSSLAGLLASRAVLEGHGVGNAEASATDALLLTILQDTFSRLCTIISAYYLGTSLYPEAKTYRLLADILNDIALVLDSLSPHLSKLAFDILYTTQFPFVSCTLVHRPGPLRAVALCMSGVFRAICGVVAGGSKAALTLHFAQPANEKGTGDVGDLSAKDGSKETVLALFGMLCGSALMPYVTDTQTTYALLALLVTAHILLNYAAVRGVVLRSLNRQRTGLLWAAYRSADTLPSPNDWEAGTPLAIAQRERIFARPSALYLSSPGTSASNKRVVVGHCYVGTPLSSLLIATKTRPAPWAAWCPPWHSRHPAARWTADATPSNITTLLSLFSQDRFILWFDRTAPSTLHIVLKDGHTPADHARAWVLASELASRCTTPARDTPFADLVNALQEAKQTVDAAFPGFVKAVRGAGWDEAAAAGGFVTGLPTTVCVEEGESRKAR